jgi:hypothetical protein
VAFGPNTQAAIADRGGRRPYTTVVEQMGTVAVAADVREVQHFAVETPYLVAVVKGTVFTVTTGRLGSSVKVSRGLVEVTGTGDHHSVLVAAGQTASASATGEIAVSGVPDAGLAHPVINGIVEDAAGDGGVVGTLGGALGDTVGDLGGTLGSTVGGLGDGLGSTVGDLGDTLGGTIGDMTGAVGVGSAVSGATGALGSTVGGVTGALGSTFGGVTGTVGNTVSGVTGSVGNTLHHLGL